MSLQYRYANKQDAAIIAQLINSAYRGESSRAGWTTEADLLTGDRIDPEGICEILDRKDSVILLCLQNEAIVGTVHVEKIGNAAYLGMFVVQPQLQGGGIGKQLMEKAESLVQAQWHVTKIWMTVISIRSELINYYERRGYVRTGRIEPFPSEVPDEFRLVKNLQFVEMEKQLA
ncbi:GNAT family N-acetyltransferase [Glaciimonas soli]|uniref:GNAT family N-acetyltransferase n=1 Tax=Glaciimonas soli TaxID=2590999 RepID=A0A843YTS1_9BURK|nr:GNAT family N-acetyltransferase [Glaciimonas soli]MQR01094.1 GNAT family N-acetyltransferase [Glaciimonas soli]